MDGKEKPPPKATSSPLKPTTDGAEKIPQKRANQLQHLPKELQKALPPFKQQPAGTSLFCRTTIDIVTILHAGIAKSRDRHAKSTTKTTPLASDRFSSVIRTITLTRNLTSLKDTRTASVRSIYCPKIESVVRTPTMTPSFHRIGWNAQQNFIVRVWTIVMDPEPGDVS